ncbi:hypothetical protein NUW54_g10593 [Trametes sanguinea]|uniref:Uncharacterized protein n=1 Tax=Trametes sanguinea TaxID=158606 RepID=A0ACC1NZT8_9APHY|nr:hypothetical protein NUW54_g10593 [Trametes sanguinea]
MGARPRSGGTDSDGGGGKTAQKRRRTSTISSAPPSTLSISINEGESGTDPVPSSPATPAVTFPVRKAPRITGRPPKELMNSAITKGVVPPTEEKKKPSAYWECVSPECHYRAFGNASEVRVFKHAATCQRLRDSHPTVYHAIVESQSSGSLGAKLSRTDLAASIAKHSTVASTTSALGSGASESTNGPSQQKKMTVTDGTLNVLLEKGTKEKKRAERAALQEKVDHTIMRLICVRGLVPSIVDSAEWKELMQSLNPTYQPSPSEKFTKEYIPREAAFIRKQELKDIQEHENITITFDGNNTRRDSIYFVHATTPDRKHYFIGGHIGTDEHHTVAWVKDKVMQVRLSSTVTQLVVKFVTSVSQLGLILGLQSIKSVGISRTAAVCSDSTTVTLNTRSEISTAVPTIFDLRDCCHHLHNIIADITKLSAFREPMSDMKRIVSHFSKSTYGRAMLQQETDSGRRLLGLQKVGKTRFGSHWSAAQSLLPALPRIRELVQAKEIKFKHKRIQGIFAVRYNIEYTRLEHALVQYTTIVEPLIRSLWALEASTANAADVFIFFTACAASLRDLFAIGSEATGITNSVAKAVTDIFNDRYDQFFFHNEIYFAAFALDPRYPISDYLLIPPTAEPSITIPREGADLEHRHPRAYDRMKLFVREALKDMFNCKDDHPNEPLNPLLAKLGRNQASIELKEQLEAYWDGLAPFNTPIGTRSTLAYWKDLEHHQRARVLAVGSGLSVPSLLQAPNARHRFVRLFASRSSQSW